AATVLIHPHLYQAGTATIIEQPTAEGVRIIVVDTGGESRRVGRGGQAVLETLQQRGIDHIDLLIITHLDTDHYAGYKALLRLRGAPPAPDALPGTPRGPPIAMVVRPEFDRGNRTVVEFTAAMDRRHIPILMPGKADDLAAIANRYGLTILAAPNPRTTNDSSLVIIVSDT